MDQKQTPSSVAAPTLRVAVGTTVVPGDRLGTLRDVLPGLGTRARGGHVYSTVVGTLQVVLRNASDDDGTAAATTTTTSGGTGNAKFRAVVVSSKPVASTQALKVGDVVLAHVERIATMQCFVVIVAMNNSSTDSPIHSGAGGMILQHPCDGTIRREDVRTGASEQVHIKDNFLPRDWVLCRVISLGDSSRRYFLSTASPELGVVHALSASSGKPLVPVSWREMQCPVTGDKELRKCARPRPVVGQR